MTPIAEQAYLSTRVSVMATKLFPPELRERLATLTLPALAEHFGLSALQDEQISSGARSRAIEQSLIQTLLSELQVLVRPMDSEGRALVRAWSRKYALYNLKTLIRGKLHSLDQQEIRENLYDLPAHLRLPDQELFRAESVPELLRQLEAGPFRTIARQAREVYEQQREAFAVEAAIDQRYYMGLVRQLMPFAAVHQESLRRLVGAELDRVALMWLLRYRLSYRLSASETYYHLVPSMRHLTRERLLRLVNLDGLETILEALPPVLQAVTADSRSITETQHRIGHWALDEARWILGNSQSGVARALAYLMLREADLLALFGVVQGRLLGLPEAIIEMALGQREPICTYADAA